MSNTALVLVDLQIDFCSPTGLAAKRGKRMSEIYKILPKIEGFYQSAKQLNLPVYFTKFLYHRTKTPASISHMASSPGSVGENLYPLRPAEDDVVINKHTFDPFVGTEFHNKLLSRKVDNLLIAGVRTELCVDITAKRAVSEGYSVTIIEDMVATYDDMYLYHDSFLSIFKKYYGSVKRSDSKGLGIYADKS